MTNILKKKQPQAITPSSEELVGMFFGWADPPDLHVGFAVLPYIKGLTEPLSRLGMEYKLQADPLRHYNKSLFLRNQDHPRNDKQMSFTRSHAPITRGVISVRLVDVYKQGRKNILETQKPSKKVLILLHMPGWTTIPSTLTMHTSLTREISVLEKSLESWHTYDVCMKGMHVSLRLLVVWIVGLIWSIRLITIEYVFSRKNLQH